MQTFWNIFIGSQSVTAFLAAAFFALVGVVIGLLLNTTKRDAKSPGSPVDFSWNYLLWDNAKRILLNVLLIYVAIRFCPDLFGIQITEFWGMAIGLGLDKIAQILKEKTNLLGGSK